MRFLFPVFLVGVVVVALPVVLHLLRRRTRKEVPFSTLMFLTASAPRFDSRKRIEHKFLLALRCLAILLLAGAFARPFFTRPMPFVSAGAGERLVLLIDTSASMRRESLWADAVAKARARLDETGPADRVAVLTFDRVAHTVMSFADWVAVPPGERASAAAGRLAALQPSWAATDLGRGLLGAAEAIADDRADRKAVVGTAAEVVVCSDLQQGSRLEALRASDWPQGVELTWDTVRASGATNAAVQVLSDPFAAEADTAAESVVARLRVRVTNATGGKAERFTVVREGAGGVPLSLDVPAGATRVVPLPWPANGAPGQTLMLSGDDHDFDNRFFVAAPAVVPTIVVYVGNDGDDPKGALFYLRRAFPATRLRRPEIGSRPPDQAMDPRQSALTQLFVVNAPLGTAAIAGLRAYLDLGRTILLVLNSPQAAADVARLTGGAGLTAVEAQEPDGYAILTQIDFGHSALAPFADARYADFTKIRFWKHRRIDENTMTGARVLARFDDGSPAWLTVPAGKGQLFVMASGWHPADSQLALSSKFVPLLHGLVESSAGLYSGQSQYFVGDPVLLLANAAGSSTGDGPVSRRVRKPDGFTVALAPDTVVFTDTDAPGLYTVESAGTPHTFAVNLAPSESATAPMPPEELDRLGLAAGRGGTADVHAPRPGDTATVTFLAGLESGQKLWRWAILGLLIVLVTETWLAGLLGRKPARQADEGAAS